MSVRTDLVILWSFLAIAVERFVEIIVKLIPSIHKKRLLGIEVPVLLAFFFSLIIAMGTALDFFQVFNIEFRLAVRGLYTDSFGDDGRFKPYPRSRHLGEGRKGGKTDSSKENGEKHEGLTGVLKSAHTKFFLTPRSGASTHGAGLRPGLPEPIVGKGTTRALGGDGLEGFEVSFRRVKNGDPGRDMCLGLLTSHSFSRFT